MKKTILLGVAVIAMMSLTGCYDFARKQNELDAESKGRATLLEAESSKKAKIEEAKADLESAKLEKETALIRAEAKAKEVEINAKSKAEAIKTIGDAVSKNPDYIKYLTVDAMYNHGNTIYVPTEAGLPILQRK